MNNKETSYDTRVSSFNILIRSTKTSVKIREVQINKGSLDIYQQRAPRKIIDLKLSRFLSRERAPITSKLQKDPILYLSQGFDVIS